MRARRNVMNRNRFQFPNTRRFRKAMTGITRSISSKHSPSILMALVMTNILLIIIVVIGLMHILTVSGDAQKEQNDFKFDDDTNIASLSSIMTPQQRLRVLELKVNAQMNWAKDSSFGHKTTSFCQNISNLMEFAGATYVNDWSHSVCMDRFSSPKTDGTPCLVYDFGVRQQPQFGLVMAEYFQCEVHAFDPSPVSVDWFNALPDDHVLKAMDNYHFHPIGISGRDGDVELFEYNWNQVSSLKYPQYMLKCGEIGDETMTHCNYTEMDQKSYTLPVKTLSTIIKELQHEHRTIDIMKIDVEGAEWAFLYSMFDVFGCPDFIEQLTVEWHHFGIDPRFGEDSNPDINVLSTMLHACGLKTFWVGTPTDPERKGRKSWKSMDKIHHDLEMYDVRYALQSFHRDSTQSI